MRLTRSSWLLSSRHWHPPPRLALSWLLSSFSGAINRQQSCYDNIQKGKSRESLTNLSLFRFFFFWARRHYILTVAIVFECVLDKVHVNVISSFVASFSMSSFGRTLPTHSAKDLEYEVSQVRDAAATIVPRKSNVFLRVFAFFSILSNVHQHHHVPSVSASSNATLDTID